MADTNGYKNGDFGWNELSVSDAEIALAFYQKIFGWKVESMDMPNGKYYILLNGEEKIGGITTKPTDQTDTPSHWMPYIAVEDVDKTAAEIEKHGGTILMPPNTIPVPNGPRLTILKDPCGATLGAITYTGDC